MPRTPLGLTVTPLRNDAWSSQSTYRRDHVQLPIMTRVIEESPRYSDRFAPSRSQYRCCPRYPPRPKHAAGVSFARTWHRRGWLERTLRAAGFVAEAPSD